MQVDWAGETIPYYDAATGDEYKAYLFVATLPCSCFYVEACGDMKQENWLLYFSLAEVKEAVAERLEIINTTPFQKRPGNRREAYLSEEKEFRLYLPSVLYEPDVWKQATVRNDYLISDGQNKYSVPYDLIGEQVQLRLTKNTVEVFFKGERVASHHRLTVFQTQPVVKPEHMPEKHRRYLRYNADDFRLWAKSIGNSAERVVDYFLKSGSSQEQGYKNCVALMKYGEKYG